ncbi:MAG: NUDIX domain-containing protein [Promethearchaeota archaeon]
MPKPKTPSLTVDAVILVEKKKKIVLIRRKNPTYQGELALPGGFVDIGETVEAACIRETKEETSLDVKINKLIGVFSRPERDPRGHTVSIAYLCTLKYWNQKPKAEDDAESLEIHLISDIPSLDLAFDHMDIVKASGILEK